MAEENNWVETGEDWQIACFVPCIGDVGLLSSICLASEQT